MQQALPSGWIAQFDSNYQRYFYVNTATGQTQWEMPSSVVHSSHSHPHGSYSTLPHDSLHQSINSVNYGNSSSLGRISAPLTPSAQPPSSLPAGFITQTDPASGKLFYINTATGVSQWELPASHHHSNPNQPAYHSLQSSPAAVPANSIASSFATASATGTHQPYQPYPSQAQQPSLNSQHLLHATPSQSSLNRPVLPHRPSISSLSNFGSQQQTFKVDAGAVAATSSLLPLPAGFIAAQDPASGKTFYVNTENGKSQWNDPREDNPKPQIPPRTQPHEGSKNSLNQGQAETPRISVTAVGGGASAPPSVDAGNAYSNNENDNELVPSAPIENLLDALSLVPVAVDSSLTMKSNEHLGQELTKPPSLPRISSSLSRSRPSGLEAPVLIPERSLSLGRGSRRKQSQSSAPNLVIYWQKDYTETTDRMQDGEGSEIFSTIQEAVVYFVYDYLISLFTLLPQINESSIRLNKELEETVGLLRLGPSGATEMSYKDILAQEKQIRKSMIKVWERQLVSLKKSFESDRKDFVAGLEHRIVRYLVAKSIPLDGVESIDHDGCDNGKEFLASIVRSVSCSTLNLRNFMGACLQSSFDLYSLLLYSIESGQLGLDWRWGNRFKNSLQTSLAHLAKSKGPSYWSLLFPPIVNSTNDPHQEAKVYQFEGPTVFTWPQSVVSPALLLMEHPDSILLDDRHIVAMPVYYQAVQAMYHFSASSASSISSVEMLDRDQLLAVLLCHPQEAGEALLTRVYKIPKDKVEGLMKETAKNRARLTASASFSSSPRPSAATLPKPSISGSNLSPVVDAAATTTGSFSTLPLPPKSPAISTHSASSADGMPRNPRLHPVENPDKIKNWDDQTVTAADTFSSLKRTIKSKFITEEAIPEAERALELEEQVKEEEEEHRRPLYFQLKENRQKNEEEFEEMFKLSSRIHKVNQEEYAFYQSIEQKELEREREIKAKEQEGIKLFQMHQQQQRSQQHLASLEVAGPSTSTTSTKVPEVLVKKKDIQKEALGKGVVLRKRAAAEDKVLEASHKTDSTQKEQKKQKTIESNNKKPALVADYGSSDSD